MLLVRRAGEAGWHSPKVTAYSDEAALQSLVGQSPDLLPGADGLMAVITEVPVATIGYADIVGVDRAGTITLVECKLKANPEIRRQVVGQIFAYAAGLTGLSYEAFDALFASKRGESLADQVRARTTAGDGWDEESFRVQVAENLRTGQFRLVIAVDEITDELKAVVRYLNAHTVAEVPFLALELHYVADDGFEVLVPQTYGDVPTIPGSPVTEEALFRALAKGSSEQALQAARDLFDYAKARGVGFNWGKGKLKSATARFQLNGKPLSALSFYESSNGKHTVAVNFGWLRDGGVSNEQLAALANGLRANPLVAEKLVGVEQADYQKFPTLLIDGVLTKPNVLETIKQAFDELLKHAGEPTSD